MGAPGRHIAPHRLALAVAGRVTARDASRIADHLAACDRCSRAAHRLEGTRAAMRAIAAQPDPELRWDHIGARIYWSTSSARYAALRHADRPWWRRWPVALGLGLAVAGAATLAVVFGLGAGRGAGGGAAGTTAASRGAQAERAQPTPGANPAASSSPHPATPLEGVVTFARGDVTLGGKPVRVADLFARQLGPGAHLATRAHGRVVVQFGRGSGFVLGPNTSLELRRFDQRAVELAVDGTVEVEVSRRAPGQTFAVVAGHHRVSVRGTGFRVESRDRQLDVVCAHGLVVVTGDEGGDDGEVSLGPGQTVHLWRQTLLRHARRQPVDPARLAALDRSLAGPLLPAWTEPRALFDTSSTLTLEAGPGRRVRVDGDVVGEGDFSLRVMSGRHHLEVAGARGGWGKGAWVVAAPGARQVARAGADGAVHATPAGEPGGAAETPDTGARQDAHDAAQAAQEASPRAARRVRRAQLDQALVGSAGTHRCMSPLEKRDLVAGSFIVFDIGIDGGGTQAHLNVVDSNVPPEVERCLRQVVDGLALPAGPAATLHYRLSF